MIKLKVNPKNQACSHDHARCMVLYCSPSLIQVPLKPKEDWIKRVHGRIKSKDRFTILTEWAWSYWSIAPIGYFAPIPYFALIAYFIGYRSKEAIREVYIKVYYSYKEVVIIGVKICYRSTALIAYFAPITLFCSNSLFYRLSEHKTLSYF